MRGRIENELHKRKQLGKVATIAGIATVSLGMAMSATTFSSCVKGDPKPPEGDPAPPYEDTTHYAGMMGDKTWYDTNGEDKTP